MTARSCMHSDSFKRYVESIRPPEGTDLTYRPEPIQLEPQHFQILSRPLQRLLQQREALRAPFVLLNEACEKAEDDDSVSVETFADMDERRNEALSRLNVANEAVLMFEPRSIADLRVVVVMARHLMASGYLEAMSDLPEEVLEHLLSSVEHLLLDEQSFNRPRKGGSR